MNRCLMAAAGLSCLLSWASVAVSAEIVIRNDSDRPFYYSIRDRAGQPWSKSTTVEPRDAARITTDRAKQISYLSDRAHFAELQPGRTYRITDVRAGRLSAVIETQRPLVPDTAEPASEAPATQQSESESGGTASAPRPPKPSGNTQRTLPKESAKPQPRSASELPAPPPSTSPRTTPSTPAAPSTVPPATEPADQPPRLEPDKDPFERLFDEARRVPDIPSPDDAPATQPPTTQPPASSTPSESPAPTEAAKPAESTLPAQPAPSTQPAPSANSDPPVTTTNRPETGPAVAATPNATVEARRPVRWSQDDIREVRVRALADETYRTVIRDWRDRVPSIIGGASDYYEREFGIRLVFDRVEPWDYKALDDKPADQWLALLRQSPGDADLVIAFAGFGDFYRAQPDTSYTGRIGQAAFFGQHVLIADQHDIHENRPKTTLIHELGHVFGAFHIDDSNLVMTPNYQDLPAVDIISGRVAFGDVLREIVVQTRTFDFQQGVEGLPPALRTQIQKSYRQHGLPSEQGESDPVTSGYEYLKERAEQRARELEQKAQQSRTDYLTVAR